MHDVIQAFSIKLRWKFSSSKSLWAQFMNAKYVKNKHELDCQRTQTCSSTWNRLMSLNEMGDSQILDRWLGNNSFWKDLWLPQGRLCELADPPPLLQALSVREAPQSLHSW